MSVDIFGYDRKAQPATIFSTEASVLTIANAGQVFLGQNVQVGYNQRIDEVFEIGSSDVYWIGGRPVGQGSIGRLVAPTKSIIAAQTALQLCNGGGTLDIKMGQTCKDQSNGAGSAQGLTLHASGVVMEGKSYVLNAQQISIIENLTLRIAKLEENQSA